MAIPGITINWASKVITLARTYSIYIDPDTVELDVNDLWEDLHNIQDGEGITFDDIFLNNEPISFSGITLSRVFQIINDYKIEFEDGLYAVNVVGANNNLLDVRIFNSVSVNVTNSAGQVVSDTAQALDYQNEVVVSAQDGVAGTEYPVGTNAYPTASLADGLIIAEFYGFSNIRIRDGNYVLTTGVNAESYNFWSTHPASTIEVEANANIENTTFHGLNLTGNLNNHRVYLSKVNIDNIINFTWEADNCKFTGNLSLGNNAEVLLNDCVSHIPGTNRPTVSLPTNTSCELSVRGYSGGLHIANMSHADCTVTTELNAGKVSLAASNTNGYISVRGTCYIDENLSSGITIDDSATVGNLVKAYLASDLATINSGIKKASLLIPHLTDL